MARRRAHQRRAILLVSGLVSALVLYVAGSGWELSGYAGHTVARTNERTTAAAHHDRHQWPVKRKDVRQRL